MVVLPTSDSVATRGIGAAGSLRSDSDWQTGYKSIVRNPSALRGRLAVRGSEVLSTKKLVKARAFLTRSQYCYPGTSLYGR